MPRTARATRAALAAAIALYLLFAAVCAFGRQGRGDRIWHPEALAWVADQPADSAEVPTHLRLEGRVEAVHLEADGDTHIRVAWNGRSVVCECIPELPCSPPLLGQRIAIWGIHRYDSAPGHDEPGVPGARGWHELHPVIGWEVAP